MRRVELLLRHKVVPLMIFDGDNLEMKRDVNSSRHEERMRNLKEGWEHHQAGRKNEAQHSFSKAVDISPYFIYRLIERLKAARIQYVVAPYEADSQIAYCCRNGIAYFAISEDSDCIPFGCDRVLFKLDTEGKGFFFERSKLKKCGSVDFRGFTDDMMLDMCILAGCDYLPSAGGVGPKGAYKLVKHYRQTERILKGLRFNGTFVVPRDYEDRFWKARLTFRHQIVFAVDKPAEGAVPLTPIPENARNHLPEHEKGMAFIGSSDFKAIEGISKGLINPISKVPFADEKNPTPPIRTLQQEIDRKNPESNFSTLKSLFTGQCFQLPQCSVAHSISSTRRISATRESAAVLLEEEELHLRKRRKKVSDNTNVSKYFDHDTKDNIDLKEKENHSLSDNSSCGGEDVTPVVAKKRENASVFKTEGLLSPNNSSSKTNPFSVFKFRNSEGKLNLSPLKGRKLEFEKF